MRKHLFVFIAVCITCQPALNSALAETIIHEPQGALADVDTKQAIKAMQVLMGKHNKAQQHLVEAILASPGDYEPPVLATLSHRLFSDGRRDEGSFWFYASQLRARFDANRCTDETAGAAVAVLTQQFGPQVNMYMFQDLDKLESMIFEVAAWDRSTPHNYDHRWINLHGMGAFMEAGANEPLSAPEDEWDEIAERTRTTYLDGFQKALIELRSTQPQAN